MFDIWYSGSEWQEANFLNAVAPQARRPAPEKPMRFVGSPGCNLQQSGSQSWFGFLPGNQTRRRDRHRGRGAPIT
jgi:hypothetical protein